MTRDHEQPPAARATRAAAAASLLQSRRGGGARQGVRRRRRRGGSGGRPVRRRRRPRSTSSAARPAGATPTELASRPSAGGRRRRRRAGAHLHIEVAARCGPSHGRGSAEGEGYFSFLDLQTNDRSLAKDVSAALFRIISYVLEKGYNRKVLAGHKNKALPTQLCTLD